MEKDLMELVESCGVAKPEKSDKIETAQRTADLLAELGFAKAAAGIKGRVNPIIKKAEIAAGGYIEITPEKIQAFLNRRADEYNKSRPAQVKKRGASSIFSAGTLYLNNSGTSTQDMRRMYESVLSDMGSLGASSQSISTSTASYWQTTALLNAYNQAVTVRAPESLYAQTVDFQSTDAGTVGRFEWLEVPVESYAGIPPMKVLEKFKDVKAKKVFDYFTVASVNAVKDPLLCGRIENSTSRYFIGQWGDDVSLDDVI